MRLATIFPPTLPPAIRPRAGGACRVVNAAARIASLRSFTREPMEMDAIMIGIGIVFFALSFAYTSLCDRL
ncbi:hypothetical protein C7I84_27615 [Mesorhizobium ephedrae]|uniref:Uncharacterized protein n=1 Tax=Kumtagia ephedrae TaxID=2116701 RepID=A0A2P7RMB5_9HYPH|nr:hypothetical protein C7I84_27615 [Mesorhizobium ephedrae]